MSTYRSISFFEDNSQNLRIASSLTGDIDPNSNIVVAPTNQLVNYNDFPRNGRILMRVGVVPNAQASSSQVFIPNITFFRSGDPDMDRAIDEPLGAINMGKAKLALIRAYNYSDLLASDPISISFSGSTMTASNGYQFKNGELIYFPSSFSGSEKTDIYTVVSASSNTCQLKIGGSYSSLSFGGTPPTTCRVFNSASQSLKVVKFSGSVLKSWATTAIVANNDVVNLIGKTGATNILPDSNDLNLAVLSSDDLSNIKEDRRYKVVNFSTGSSPNPKQFKIASTDSSSALNFTASTNDDKIVLVANLGTNIVVNSVKIKHSQRFRTDFPLGGFRQVDPNQITVYRVSTLPRYVWFLIDIIDTLEGDFKYILEYEPSLQDMMLYIDSSSGTDIGGTN